MKISIYTFTMGREEYLYSLAEAIMAAKENFDIEHHIIYQGKEIAAKTDPLNMECYKSFGAKVHIWETNIGIADGMNKILPQLDGDVIIKMDDDALPVNRPIIFFKHIELLCAAFPNAVWSPYPVGLINNPGGVKGIKHQVIHMPSADMYYTLRHVDHVGGFCRVSPGYTRDWKFQPDLIPGQSGNEDSQFSAICRSKNIPMFYTENGPVVEHRESTLGQHARYGSEYFKGRF